MSFGLRLTTDDDVLIDEMYNLFSLPVRLGHRSLSALDFSVSLFGGLAATLNGTDVAVESPFSVSDGKWHRVSLVFQNEAFKLSWDGSDSSSSTEEEGEKKVQKFAFLPNSHIDFGKYFMCTMSS